LRLFCPEPFEHLEIAVEGNVYVCCSGWVPRPVGNILSDDISKIWNGEKIRQVRDSITDNSFTYCLECPYLPGPHGTVQPVDQPPPKEPTSARIAVLTLAYDRTCNLACPSCRSVFFKSDQAHELQARAISTQIIRSSMLESVARMIVAGSGDPFASSVYTDLLRNVPWQAYPHLKVGLYTNALLADESNWARFGRAVDRIDQVTVSVDAASPQTYALNRGGNWSHLLENLNVLSRMRTAGRLNLLRLVFIVQTNNYREVPVFVDLARSYNVDCVRLGKLRNWGAYSPSDYARRAVHLSSHPEHLELLRVMRDERLRGRQLVIANLGQDEIR
jgi:radical SAM protein with 4Fe4S-binding SPASM domain